MIKEDIARPKLFPVVRYPGGKRAMLHFLAEFLPESNELKGRYIEPFVGGASVFLFVGPNRALLADSNSDLIDLYRAIESDPAGVWTIYQSFGPTKEDYLHVRGWRADDLDETIRAARLLYLNRTCFKGNDIMRAKTPGYIRMLTRSHRFVVSMQANRFTPPAKVPMPDSNATVPVTA